MSWSREVRRRRMRNYRLMFRVALLCVAISLVVTVFGGLKAVVDAQVEWLVFGLLMFVWSAGCAYLTIDSTVKIIDVETVETQEAKPRSG